MSKQNQTPHVDGVTAYSADTPDDVCEGDRVIRTEVDYMTSDSGDKIGYVTIEKGRVQQNGEFGPSPEFNGNQKSVGNDDPEDLRLIAEALNKTAEKLERQ